MEKKIKIVEVEYGELISLPGFENAKVSLKAAVAKGQRPDKIIGVLKRMVKKELDKVRNDKLSDSLKKGQTRIIDGPGKTVHS